VVNQYIERMGQRIVANTDKAELPWVFRVIEEESVNAFNAPGGLVYIHTGLIAAAENAAELAAVVAHEIGHGVARHGAQQLTRQYEMAILAEVILGRDPGMVSEIAAAIVAGGAQARHSREHEHEADELGVRFMAEAGYDPRGMAAFFQTLDELREREPGTVERFFATHPPVPDRVERVEAEIDRLERTDQLTMTDDEFEEIRRRVR
jgi:beta-barrel assembly-enhancing protease